MTVVVLTVSKRSKAHLHNEIIEPLSNRHIDRQGEKAAIHKGTKEKLSYRPPTILADQWRQCALLRLRGATVVMRTINILELEKVTNHEQKVLLIKTQGLTVVLLTVSKRARAHLENEIIDPEPTHRPTG